MMPDFEIRNLDGVAADEVVDAFCRAFGDYAVQFDRRLVGAQLQRRGYNPHLSFAAFEGGSIVAFVLNGTGCYDGMESCYDCGTAALPGYRGKGLVSALFRHALPQLREAGFRRYVLEVLSDNDSAVALYRAKGFRKFADYRCFRADAAQLHPDGSRAADAGISIVGANLSELSQWAHFADFTPSWQNSAEALERGRDGLIANAAIADGAVAGYCVHDPLTGDISTIAVDRRQRRRGIASALLSEALRTMSSPTVKVLNVDSRDQSLPAFLKAVGMEDGLSQYAMSLDL